MPTTSYTYDNNSMREDLLSIITNIDFNETQLFAGLATSRASNILHEWQKEALDTPGPNAQIEGVDAVSRTLTDTTRLYNYTQIVTKPYIVSGTSRAIEAAGYEDKLAHEAEKAMKAWKQDVEFALMRGTLVCGTGSAARSMGGIKSFLTSNSYGANNFTNQSGVSLTETALNDYFQAVWDDGVEVDAVYAPMYLKRKISAFTTNNRNTVNVDAIDKRLVLAVDVYMADAAKMVKLFAHKYVTRSGDTNYDLVGIKEDFFRVAYLRQPEIQQLAKTGDAEKEQVVGEMTLECLHNEGGFLTTEIL